MPSQPERASLLPQNTRRSLPMTLLRAREAVMGHFRPILAEHDVTEQQWRVIRVLGEQSPLDASELAERASILAPSLTRIIKALEDRDLITRSRGPDDGRRVLLAIAPKGFLLLERVAPASSAIYRAVERRFGVERYALLLDLLEDLIASETAAGDVSGDAAGRRPRS
ncbi:MAG: homoprotocatechuate degradation operon regulator HpaR [Hyphomicrobiales bacterium]|nr:MAG: homoprotocatechuate degradation operon regulator HpaR [Hyphomicrobiales bacterium]